MKKIILILPLVIMTQNAYSALTMSCLYPDGSTVTTGQYCPGTATPCGTGGGVGGGGKLEPVIDAYACPSACPSDTTWTENSEKGYYAKCVWNGTIPKCKYECMTGYYGDPLATTTIAPSCEKCPGNGTSTRGSTVITDCYITGGSDATGTHTYTSPCYYSR
ncbi:MAG: hypothetical protein NC311_06315 [Muribaculaceae bacterium]|nr:hypothetical protein [Muribaculaceae bacterium]